MDFISVIVSGAATSLSKQLLNGVLAQSLVVLISSVLVVLWVFNHLFMYFVYIGVYSLESGLSFHSVQSQGLNLGLQSCQQTP